MCISEHIIQVPVGVAEFIPHTPNRFSKCTVAQTLDSLVPQVTGNIDEVAKVVPKEEVSGRFLEQIIVALGECISQHTVEQIVGVSDRQGNDETDDFAVTIWKEIFEVSQSITEERVLEHVVVVRIFCVDDLISRNNLRST